MKKGRILVCVLFGAAATAAYGGDFQNGNDLRGGMVDYERIDEGKAQTPRAVLFFGYVLGVSDAYSEMQRAAGASEFCLPRDATAGQVAHVVAKYMKEHPERLADPAASLVLKAMIGAFPCASDPPTNPPKPKTSPSPPGGDRPRR